MSFIYNVYVTVYIYIYMYIYIYICVGIAEKTKMCTLEQWGIMHGSSFVAYRFALKVKLPSMNLLNPTCEPSVRHWLLYPLVINHGRLENPGNEWRF